MLALGDALAFTLSRSREFGRDDFARFHPSGSLGKKLARVEVGHVAERCGIRPLHRRRGRSREVFAQVRRARQRSR